MSAHRCDRYVISSPEMEGVTFCRKEGARVVIDLMRERDSLRIRVKELEAALRDAIPTLEEDVQAVQQMVWDNPTDPNGDAVLESAHTTLRQALAALKFERDEATSKMVDQAAARGAAEARVKELEVVLRYVLASAVPNPVDHPTMSRAWAAAEATLRDGGK